MILILVIYILILGFSILLPDSRFLAWFNRTLKRCVFWTVEQLEVVVSKMYRLIVATVSTLYRWIAHKMVALYRWTVDILSRFFLWSIDKISRILRWCIEAVKTFPIRHRILYSHVQCAIFSTLPLGLTVYFETYILIALRLVTDKATAKAYSWKLSIAVDQMATLLGFGQARIQHLLINRRGVNIHWSVIFGYEALGIALGALANWPHATHRHHQHDAYYSPAIWCMAFLALFPAIVLYIKLVNYVVKDDDDDPANRPKPVRTRPRHFYLLARTQFKLAVCLVTFGCFLSASINYSAQLFHNDVSHPSVVCYNNMAVQGFVLIIGRLASALLDDGSFTSTLEYALTAFVRAIGATPAALFGNTEFMDFAGWWHAFVLNHYLFAWHYIKSFF